MGKDDRPVRVAGSGSYLPARMVDNHALYEIESIRRAFDVEQARASLRGIEAGEAEAMSPADVFDLWSRQVTGIVRRRILEEEIDRSTEWMCAEACRRALAAAEIEASRIDFLVAASLTPKEVVPNLACTVGEYLGIPEVGGFVLNAACAGFIHGLATAHAFIRSGAARNALVVSGDTLSKIVNYDDPKTAVLFGDGAGAVVLSAERGAGRVLGTPYLVSDYSPTHLNMDDPSWVPPDQPLPKLGMAGGAHVLRQAIKAMLDAAEQGLERAGLEWEDVDYVVPHQANGRITRGIEKAVAGRGVRVLDTIEEYGNMSASTVAIGLDELIRGKRGPLPEVSRIVLTAVGGGYTVGAAVVEWNRA